MTNPTKAERLAEFLNQRRSLRSPPEPVTYHSTAIAELVLEEGGRFATDTRVSGEAPSVTYPRSGFTDPTGVEGPLGYEIDAVQPVGTAEEIAASLAAIPPAAEEDQSELREGMKPSTDDLLPVVSSVGTGVEVGLVQLPPEVRELLGKMIKPNIKLRRLT